MREREERKAPPIHRHTHTIIERERERERETPPMHRHTDNDERETEKRAKGTTNTTGAFIYTTHKTKREVRYNSTMSSFPLSSLLVSFFLYVLLV